MMHKSSQLESVLHPESVAVVGASSGFGKWGQIIFTNILGGNFPGRLYAVNPNETSLCGLPVYADMADVPEGVDLAVVTTPAATVKGILQTCGRKGVKGVVMVSSGFGETDAAGKRLEAEVTALCRKWGMVLIGPNTMGIISPHSRLFATGTHSRPSPGGVAFISQSGNLGNQLIHWAQQQGIGISLFVGSGNEAMITSIDYLTYLAEDPRTRIILLYLENVGNGRAFLEAVERVNPRKPVVVLKGGRTEAGRRAAASHTGSMGGRDTLFSAACRQAGVVRVSEPSALLDLSAGFSALPLPRGNRVGIVTLGGGWGVVTADACMERGLVVPAIPDTVIRIIDKYLPPFWSRSNPVDLVGTRDTEVPLVAVAELLKCDGIDAVISLGIVGRIDLVRSILETTGRVDPQASPEFLARMEAFARAYEQDYVTRMVSLMETYEKPVVGVTLAQTEQGVVRPVEGKRYGGVFYQTPEDAVRVLAGMVQYQRSVSRSTFGR